MKMQSVYQEHGEIWTLVMPKMDMIPDLFTLDEAIHLLNKGAIRLDWACYNLYRQRSY